MLHVSDFIPLMLDDGYEIIADDNEPGLYLERVRYAGSGTLYLTEQCLFSVTATVLTAHSIATLRDGNDRLSVELVGTSYWRIDGTYEEAQSLLERIRLLDR